MTTPKLDPKEARSRLTILDLKYKSGAMEPGEAMAFDQAKLASIISRCSSYLSRSELYNAITTYRNLIKSESMMLLLGAIMDCSDKGLPLEAIIGGFGTQAVEEDSRLDSKRKELHALLLAKLDLVCANEDRCFSTGEI